MNHTQSWLKFTQRINETLQQVANISVKRAIRIIAEAEGIDREELTFYGYEVLEHHFGLKFGSIKEYLQHPWTVQ